MGRKMPGTSKRSDTRTDQFNRRLPADLVGKAIGHPVVINFPMLGTTPGRTVSARLSRTHVRFSLGTTDARVSDHRAALAVAHLETLYAELRRGPQRLTHKQTVALSGDVYALVVAKFDENPGSPDHWAAFKILNRAAREGRMARPPQLAPRLTGDDLHGGGNHSTLTGSVNAVPPDADVALTALEHRFGLLTDWTLATKGLVVDGESRVALLHAVEAAATNAGWRMKRAASGDYSVDPNASRFPAWYSTPSQPDTVAPPPTASGPSWDGIITAWETAHAARGGPQPTRTEWRSRVTSFAKWADADPVAVTEAKLREWRDKRLKDGVSPVTVGSGDLMMLRSIFKHAINERLLSGPNPVADVRVTGASRAARTMRGFTEDDANVILAAALREREAYRRWLPWLCAFTGSRASAVMNLRPSDIKFVEGLHCVEFSSEAGPLKTRGSERIVPIHAALIADGFLEFVASRRGHGRLFYDERRLRNATAHNPGKGRLNSLRRWLHGIEGVEIGREHGKDPSHAWRHWLKTKLRDAGVADTVSDGITGHAPRTEGGSYGGVSLRAMADAVSRVEVPKMATSAAPQTPLAGPVRLPEAAE